MVSTTCSICYNQPPINAIKLDCGHIFCYLCIKSASETTGTCALCRVEIGVEFNFQEHPIVGVAQVPYSANGHYWFYEGYKGWWLYDAETNREIEEAYQRQQQEIEKFIAGYIYVIDIRNLIQRRKGGDGRSRKICRATLDLENINGMAGLRGHDFEELLGIMRSARMVGANCLGFLP